VELIGEGPGVAPAQDALAAGGEEIVRAMESLPEVFRNAVVLRDMEDFTYDEIARILEVPVGTVMSRIHRGRALLRTALARRPA
jgi:RNA polymerase sigma-70 factor (ECF subfamily)